MTDIASFLLNEKKHFVYGNGKSPSNSSFTAPEGTSCSYSELGLRHCQNRLYLLLMKGRLTSELWLLKGVANQEVISWSWGGQEKNKGDIMGSLRIQRTTIEGVTRDTGGDKVIKDVFLK